MCLKMLLAGFLPFITTFGKSFTPQSNIDFLKNPPNNRLNIAVIGVGGRGKANWGKVPKENIIWLKDGNLIDHDSFTLKEERS